MNEHPLALEDLDAPELARRLAARMDAKTKPLGALGRLEALALRIGLILGTDSPRLVDPQMLVCAADHGLAAHGVSAYPSEVTAQMVRNFLAGGAAVSVLARQHGISLTVADCGVARDLEPHPRLVNCKLAHGTRDPLAGPAMTAAECEGAIANGASLVRALPGNALLLGEMGIGNTSAASLLLARLTGHPIAECTGAGTGLEGPALARKIGILETVLGRHAEARAPLAALAAFGGLEIATLVGAVLQAARERRVIVVDGFIVSAAVLVAERLAPRTVQRCVFAHRSGECGHGLLLRHLGPSASEPARALLDLGLRLGEGSGAALAWPLLVSACAILTEMASFESAGVSGRV